VDMVWPLYLWYAQYASYLYQIDLNIDGEYASSGYSSIKFSWTNFSKSISMEYFNEGLVEHGDEGDEGDGGLDKGFGIRLVGLCVGI